MISQIRLAQILLVAGAIVVGGCASTHNMKTEGTNLFGGGFYEDELRPGLYRMTARSNMAIWPNFGAASETWKIRADQLCGKNAYKNFETNVQDGKHEAVPVAVPSVGIIAAPSYNATISGYVLCNSSGLTITEAEDFLQAQKVIAQQEADKALKLELERLPTLSCDHAESGISGEIYFRRGKALLALKQYSDARACFVLVQEVEKDTPYYRNSCESLGLMYEIGLGVEKDMQAAQAWYRKAGLL